MKKFPLLLLITSIAISATADDTTRRRLRVDQSAITQKTATPPPCDTITAATGDIVISGYDKPLRSTGESFFVTNNLTRDITGIEVTITYLDMHHRRLHERTVMIDIDIPAGDTRRVDISSWDKRQVFFYHLGPKPRSGVASPFDVTVIPKRVILHK